MKFSLGQVVATPGALETLSEAGQTPEFFLEMHVAGNWGNVDVEDRQANDQALVNGGRILSAYRTLKNKKLWVITEAVDNEGKREATTILLPSEY